MGVTNLVYRVTDQVASWSFVQENDIPVPDFVEVPPEGLDVDIQWLPEGFFTVRDQYPESFIHEIRFENDEAESVTFVMQQLDLAGVANFDVENADRVEDVIISDALGMIVEKNGKNRVYWMDTDRQLFYEIYSETVDSETLVHIAENIILLD